MASHVAVVKTLSRFLWFLPILRPCLLADRTVGVSKRGTKKGAALRAAHPFLWRVSAQQFCLQAACHNSGSLIFYPYIAFFTQTPNCSHKHVFSHKHISHTNTFLHKKYWKKQQKHTKKDRTTTSPPDGSTISLNFWSRLRSTYVS